METPGSIASWQRFDRLEEAWCVRINRSSRYEPVRIVFSFVSRLGDGGFWYLLMLVFALSSEQGAMFAAQMAATGLVALHLYRHLKRRFVRERPYISRVGITLGAVPLDRYSFPSGHTLHAVCFTTLATAHVPELFPILVPFSILVALSRVVLGLHYPSDVFAGAVIGATLASASLAAWPV